MHRLPRLFLPVLLLAGLMAGCRSPVYTHAPEMLGLPDARVEVSQTQVILSTDEHRVVFNRGQRLATLDGAQYYLHKPAGMNALDATDASLLREALLHQVPLAKPATVMLDAGHGGKDTGCRSGRVYEKEITLAIALEVKAVLESAGCRVLLSRADNATTLSLDDRVRLASSQPIDAFVSIHVNSAARPQACGVEVYTLPAPGCDGTGKGSPARGLLVGQNALPVSTRLAVAVQQFLIRMPEAPADRGVRHAHYKVLRDTPVPAILIETGFLTNPEDAKRLTNPARRKELALAIARGIGKAFDFSVP